MLPFVWEFSGCASCQPCLPLPCFPDCFPSQASSSFRTVRSLVQSCAYSLFASPSSRSVVRFLTIYRSDPISSLTPHVSRPERLRSLRDILSSSVLPIPRTCSALTMLPPHVSSLLPLPPLLTFFSSIQINGDVVVFRFVGGNHSVVQSTLCAFSALY